MWDSRVQSVKKGRQGVPTPTNAIFYIHLLTTSKNNSLNTLVDVLYYLVGVDFCRYCYVIKKLLMTVNKSLKQIIAANSL